jgi:hypothetical protein
MEDKNESEKLMEELKRIGEGFNKFIESIGEALNKLFYPKEDEWKMKIPFEDGDEYFALNHRGSIIETTWNNHCVDEERFELGNVFLTREAAELEAKRRNLLTRFKAFRDECNGDWESDWNNHNSKKWCIVKNEEGMYAMWTFEFNSFSYFGYFKNQEDAERAIELFGDEIKELFVEKRLENENN